MTPEFALATAAAAGVAYVGLGSLMGRVLKRAAFFDDLESERAGVFAQAPQRERDGPGEWGWGEEDHRRTE
jgi:hypothetical protein